MITSVQQLTELWPGDYYDKDINGEEILSWFSILDAYWMHNGDPQAPHAELTAGRCSNAFFDCLRVLRYINLSDILANQLACRLEAAMGDNRIDWVISSPMAGITFGHDVARALGAKQAFFTEKDPGDKHRMIWNRQTIEPHESVLQVEELITTSHTTNMVQEAVDRSNEYPVRWRPYIGALVYRPDRFSPFIAHAGIAGPETQRLVVSLITKEVWAVEQKDCPLCAAGSVRLQPKKDRNWAILTGKEKLPSQ